MIKNNLQALITQYSNKIKDLEAKGLFGLIPENKTMLEYLNKELAKVICK